ncbi:hypothetical protein ACFSTC_10150 [Nonomuraea ferruginea]
MNQCGGLPLALRVAGARLASRRQWSVARLADRLDDEHRRLDELAVGDQAVRASIGLSYQLLPPLAKTALRRARPARDAALHRLGGRLRHGGEPRRRRTGAGAAGRRLPRRPRGRGCDGPGPLPAA